LIQMKGAPMRVICLAIGLLATVACSPAPEPEAAPIRLQAKPAQPPAGPPNTLRLILQVRPDGQVRLMSVTPRRDSIEAPSEAQMRQDALEGRVRILDYVGRNGPGGVLIRGQVTIPTVSVAEFQDPQARTRVRRQEQPLTTPTTVRVSVPYLPALATISFERLEPARDAPVAAWKRVPMGTVSVARQ
jgi:hypothetical protein